ncbi:MAG TPA: hypothetical protein VHY18_02515 [Solirubrobacteraceae bacterium]|jgi:hypothetical protein|nr:hypothetical protein [Solirubrobacteraceae bacterium]
MTDEKHEARAYPDASREGGDIEVPIPSREDFLGTVRKVAGPGLRKQLDETDQPPG